MTKPGESARNEATGKRLGADDDKDTVRRILAILRDRTGHDFSNYKLLTIQRRLRRRMQINRIGQMEDYLELVRGSGDEVQALFSDFLISVTTFFRDAPAFDALVAQVIPRLLERPVEAGPIRIWAAGCATGEEVYSLAILLLEEAAREEVSPEIQIFATDIDDGAINIAREGVYPLAIQADVSEERLQRFFTREGDHFRIKKNVRDLVMFATHNLLKDPPFSRLDLVSCRNLLIYLDREIQDRALATLHYGLNPGGYLFLGSAETADALTDRFHPIDSRNRIYQAIGRTEDRPPLLQRTASPGIPMMIASRDRAAPPSAGNRTEAALHHQALEELAPPSLLVDAEHRVMHLSDTAGRYLRHPGGTLSGNIMQIVLPELRPDLRRGLHRAFEMNEPSLSMPVIADIDGVWRRVVLHVRPMKRGDAVTEALVLFNDEVVQEPADSTGAATGKDGPDGEIVARLQEELEIAHEQLRLSREEYKTSSEDLRAANEELQSINEEYRSTSEELETSKEELQSMNEELQTLNSELKAKVDDLSHANADLQNLIAATEGGTLFLDPQLRIKLFTAGITNHFNIAASDEGRPITDFTHKLKYDGLADDARAVLRDLTTIEREVTNDRDEWFLVRLRPYRTLDDRIDGVVITFVDVSALHRAEAALRKADDRFRALVTATSYAIYRTSPDWAEMRELDGRGFIRDTTETRPNWLDEYIDPADQELVTRTIQRAIRTKSVFELEHRVKRRDGTIGWTLSRAVPLMDDNGEIVEWFGAASDITMLRLAAEELARTRRIETIGRLAGGIAHDFNNLLTIIMANLELAEMRVEDEGVRRFLERAAKAADLGASFNRRLLSLTGTRPSEPQNVRLNDHIVETCKLLDRALGERIELISDLADDLWSAYLDSGEVESALLNLALNARDAIPDGGSITVRTRNLTLDPERAAAVPGAHPGDYVCLEVVDAGIGMSKEVLDRASEAFFTTKEDGMGTGLGLFSVLAFVRHANGFLDIDSAPGEGTAVSLNLPRADGEPVQTGRSLETEEIMPRGSGELVLIVEDDAAVREATRQRLETLGYAALEACTAAEAREQLASHGGVRLVFSDVVMPGDEDGVNLARWIKAESPQVAVLLTSGYSAEIDNLSESEPLRNVAFLPKPYSLTEFATAVRDALK